MSDDAPFIPRSLGHRTELTLHRLVGEVRACPEYVAVRTPSNPRFYWGNYLIFAAPPAAGDLDRWSEVFRREIGEPPLIEHLAFSWDAPTGATGELAQFLDAGFERSDLIVMTAATLRPSRPAPEVALIRDMDGDADWGQWVELGVAQNAALPDDEREPAAHHRLYIEARAGEIRRMLASSDGRWFGAFIDGQLVSSAGLFVDDGLGRFQHVDTHPEFRRRGLARAVIDHAAQVGAGELGASTLVIVADDDYFAKDIYSGLGFTPVERQVELTRRPVVG